ncbi:hypothetical protein BDR03DRAFT_966333 [Suillus americanus]|nr:hypothetical protein BDR03DRAFT_966333 [Suillus americanus]
MEYISQDRYSTLYPPNHFSVLPIFICPGSDLFYMIYSPSPYPTTNGNVSGTRYHSKRPSELDLCFSQPDSCNLLSHIPRYDARKMYSSTQGFRVLAIRTVMHWNAHLHIRGQAQHTHVPQPIHPTVSSVYYHHQILRTIYPTAGWCHSVYVVVQEAQRPFCRNLSCSPLLRGLGGVESLAELPARMTHASIPPAEREALDIEGLVRLSLSYRIEEVEDLRGALDYLGWAGG